MRCFDHNTYSPDEIKTDSRKVKEGDVFFALRGINSDGHDYVTDALERKASMVLCEREVAGIDPAYADRVVIVEDTRKKLGEALSDSTGDPSSRMRVYGVTGTNGKTSTVFLMEGILRSAGRKTGCISTVFTKVADKDIRPSFMTTPDILTVYSELKDMLDNGVTDAVVEISSHALSQKRVWGVGLDSAILTNITPEHLDYHGDMDSYSRDKFLIFDQLKTDGVAVLNSDDPRVAGFKKKIKNNRVITFGIKKAANVLARNIDLSPGGTSFDIVFAGSIPRRVSTDLIGIFNVYNILGAVSALKGCGMTEDDICRGIVHPGKVPGRLEPVGGEEIPFRVFVDYAHTPDALEKVLDALRPLTKGKLICVFGCGGDRDRAKRPIMGRVASAKADICIITNDNPRSEDPEKIFEDISKGITGKGVHSVLPDRYDAIRSAVKSASPGDVIVIAGKGHEGYQIFKDGKTKFDDREAAASVIRERGCS